MDKNPAKKKSTSGARPPTRVLEEAKRYAVSFQVKAPLIVTRFTQVDEHGVTRQASRWCFIPANHLNTGTAASESRPAAAAAAAACTGEDESNDEDPTLPLPSNCASGRVAPSLSERYANLSAYVHSLKAPVPEAFAAGLKVLLDEGQPLAVLAQTAARGELYLDKRSAATAKRNFPRADLPTLNSWFCGFVLQEILQSRAVLAPSDVRALGQSDQSPGPRVQRAFKEAVGMLLRKGQSRDEIAQRAARGQLDLDLASAAAAMEVLPKADIDILTCWYNCYVERLLGSHGNPWALAEQAKLVKAGHGSDQGLSLIQRLRQRLERAMTQQDPALDDSERNEEEKQEKEQAALESRERALELQRLRVDLQAAETAAATARYLAEQQLTPRAQQELAAALTAAETAAVRTRALAEEKGLEDAPAAMKDIEHATALVRDLARTAEFAADLYADACERVEGVAALALDVLEPSARSPSDIETINRAEALWGALCEEQQPVAVQAWAVKQLWAALTAAQATAARVDLSGPEQVQLQQQQQLLDALAEVEAAAALVRQPAEQQADAYDATQAHSLQFDDLVPRPLLRLLNLSYYVLLSLLALLLVLKVLLWFCVTSLPSCCSRRRKRPSHRQALEDLSRTIHLVFGFVPPPSTPSVSSAGR